MIILKSLGVYALLLPCIGIEKNLTLEPKLAFFLAIPLVLKVTNYMICPLNLVSVLEMWFLENLFFPLSIG